MIKARLTRVRHVLPLAVAMATTGCVGKDGVRSAELSSAHYSSGASTRSATADDAAMEGVAAPPTSATAEVRHVDAYRRYRSIFDTGEGEASLPDEQGRPAQK